MQVRKPKSPNRSTYPPKVMITLPDPKQRLGQVTAHQWKRLADELSANLSFRYSGIPTTAEVTITITNCNSSSCSIGFPLSTRSVAAYRMLLAKLGIS